MRLADTSLHKRPVSYQTIRSLRGFGLSLLADLRHRFNGPPTRRRHSSRTAATESLEARTLLAFSAGNVLVFRVATTAGGNKSNSVSLVQYRPVADSLPVDVTVIPGNGGSGTLTDVPQDPSGFLNISGDGQYITLIGTEAAAGAANLNNAFRSVFRYDYTGAGRQVARLADTFTGYSSNTSPFGAATFGGGLNDATTFWTAAPAPSGAVRVRFFEYSGTGTYTSPAPAALSGTTVLNVSAYGSVLFASTATSVAYFPNPKSSAVPSVPLSGTAIAAGSGSFFLLDRSPSVGMSALNGLDTLYVVDGGAIEKYEYTGDGITNAWTARGSAVYSTTANLLSVTGQVSEAAVSLVATTAVSANNSVVTVSDTSGFGGTLAATSAAFTTLYSAGANFRFKGVQFAPTILNVAPTDITLTGNAIAENAASGTTVGSFTAVDATPQDNHTFTLVTGTGSTDNASFTIVGNQLRSNASFDFETKNSYSVRVKTTDAGGLSFEKAFTITVTNVNEAPTDIALSNSAIAENQPSGTAVGNFTATDPDAADNHTWTLVAGTGSTDNASFTIVGNQLRSTAGFNFESKSSYSIRVRATDAGTLTFEKAFTITVTNVNEAPTDIALSNSAIAENQPSGTAVGNFTATDPDAADNHTWTLVAGVGDTDNASFTIVGNQLRSTAPFNFESKSSYSIRVCAKDLAGLPFEKVITVSVSDVTELSTIDVQLGQTQRSFVRYLDLTFDRSQDIQALLASPGRFRLRRSSLLDGVNFVAHTTPAFLLSAVGPRTIRIDFSTQGIGGNRNSNVGDGYYEVGFDTDGDGSFTSAFDGRKRFYRLLGDVTGDGKVTVADDTAILGALGTTNPERDANGDGVVNSNDRTLAQRAIGRKLLDSLFSTGLDD